MPATPLRGRRRTATPRPSSQRSSSPWTPTTWHAHLPLSAARLSTPLSSVRCAHWLTALENSDSNSQRDSSAAPATAAEAAPRNSVRTRLSSSSSSGSTPTASGDATAHASGTNSARNAQPQPGTTAPPAPQNQYDYAAQGALPSAPTSIPPGGDAHDGDADAAPVPAHRPRGDSPGTVFPSCRHHPGHARSTSMGVRWPSPGATDGKHLLRHKDIP